VSSWLFVVIALLIAVLAIWQAVQIYQIRKQVEGVPKDGNVVAMLGAVTARLNEFESELDHLDMRLQSVEGRLPHAITKVGSVSYDAFGNIAGELSRSIAMLDELGSGIVLTIMVSRDDAHLFSKEVVGGVSREPLSPEEQHAVATAMRK
jgi:Protein of unknown function (DUF4446)